MNTFHLYQWSWLSCGLAIFFAADIVCSQTSVDYTTKIKPLLKSRCYACHGGLKQEAGLRLDTGTSIREGGESGAVVKPSMPTMSYLIERVAAKDQSERMPPEGQPLTEEQIELLKTWIGQGAHSPENESPETNPREHWSFRPLRRPAVPEIWFDTNYRSRNSIDAFINEKLASQGLATQTTASKPVQLRRLYLDLIGLPPTRDELGSFLRDNSVDAYEKVVERLLNSHKYGERWGRHWMDVWRYSDWYGRRHVPDVWNSAPQVWRWRDWIVRSLNEDKGYAQMIREMLAADEICASDPSKVVATGYLVRNWYALNPNDWMRNTVEHVGKAFLGLTFNCAHCHDHKYDPISQEEYFRLRAFFEPMYVRQDRVAGEADPGPFQDYDYSTLRKIQQLGAVRVFDRTPDAKTWFYTDGDERNRLEERGSISPGVPEFLPPTSSSLSISTVHLPHVAWYPGLDRQIQETVRADASAKLKAAETAQEMARKAQTEQDGQHQDDRSRALSLQVAVANRAAAQAELASVNARIIADSARYGVTEQIADVEQLIQNACLLEREATLRKLEADVVSAEHALTIAESKKESEKRSKEIDAAKKKLAAAKQARTKKVTSKPEASYSPLSPVYPKTSTGRRRALAEWITNRNNPLTARVAVNHIWMRHFHAPLVASVDDFGRNGAEPTHPELLDWLAVELIESGWSMKHLHRLIVTSETYRKKSSQTLLDTENHPAETDPENKLLWRMNVGRMEAEVIRDSLLCCGGMLDMSLGGRPLENKKALTSYRRSLYYEVFPEDGGTSQLSSLFDPPNPLDCYRRTRSIVPQQALALTNSKMVHQVSERIVQDRQRLDADLSNRRFLVETFEQILSRAPTKDELRLCLSALEQQNAIITKERGMDSKLEARQSVVRAILNHNDFVTIR